MSAVREAVAAALEPIEVGNLKADYRELLIGGTRKVKLIGKSRERAFQNLEHAAWTGDAPMKYEDDAFDEVHCYHQMQRMGRQGDFVTFFSQVSEMWRVLKNNGLLCLTVPSPVSDWMFGDPGHTRCISMQTITYLSQPEYDKQLGVTALVDYRPVYRADFEPEFLQDDHRELRIVLRAVKPSRCSLELP